MNYKIALLGLLGVVLLGAGYFLGMHGKKVALVGTTQTYPLHFVQNPTSFDQLFSWGGIENAGVSWFTGAVNASSTLTVSGASTLGSTLAVTGASTLSGGLTVAQTTSSTITLGNASSVACFQAYTGSGIVYGTFSSSSFTVSSTKPTACP